LLRRGGNNGKHLEEVTEAPAVVGQEKHAQLKV
jgi:hypothetical protein